MAESSHSDTNSSGSDYPNSDNSDSNGCNRCNVDIPNGNLPDTSRVRSSRPNCDRSSTESSDDDPTLIEVARDESMLLELIAKHVTSIADESFTRGDHLFRIGVSGGSMVTLLTKAFMNIQTQWEKWRFFFCDERVVSFDDPESTFGQYKRMFLQNIPVTEDQFIKINPELDAENAAKDYIQKMAFFFPPDRLPQFDCLMLGVGTDGHTCSLFPGHRTVHDENVWVTWETNSPKPPPNRITLTLPVINNSRMCIFIATGENKADIVKRILIEEEIGLPASKVILEAGELIWLLDLGSNALTKFKVK